MLDIPIVALVHVLENVKNVSYLGGCCVFLGGKGLRRGCNGMIWVSGLGFRGPGVLLPL